MEEVAELSAVEDAFGRFGRLQDVWIARKPGGFGFVTFENLKDAEEAVKRLDGHNGWRVEISRGRGGRPGRGGGGGGGMGRFGGGGGYDAPPGAWGPPPGYGPQGYGPPGGSPARKRSPERRRRSRSPAKVEERKRAPDAGKGREASPPRK
ncbi:hypothetical protein MNEG_4389 [Monoraphidium neglectum]|uniref:RRM domain-containing protein n=1 Tax=Monoraphidium neglectum TaxID=145388 RepID=A0A0D2L9X2_9CHLO|nr:hypothetical protein MNEG_4389 [Monoraphidium neglectum]KIZ03574.1 hypothetical protein MNEG_4389 [Monoraphidium neglectum]|eukprot:XP_013902593.1 hypothetical protein MNEG_4389 [Monoraphidium neglectum]